MLKKEPFSLKKRIQSFRYAFQGIVTLFRDEHNARIHLFVFILVCIAGLLLKINLSEWMILLLVSGVVFALELVNTALENLCDFVSPQFQKQIKKAKDTAAAAVLVSAITAVVLGFIVFIPKLYVLISSFTARFF